MKQVPEETIRSTALIMGPQSAAALAIEDAECRRRAGEDVAFFKDGSTIIVVNVALISGANHER